MDTMVRPVFDQSEISAKPESTASGVSWPAVIAGAFVTAALSFILMALGAGMGLSSVSPWPNAGMDASRIGTSAVVWIILVQLISCALGGYLAGRLRTKWVSLHTHEVYFRDTAHGFLVWAVSLVIAVAFLSSLATSVTRDAAVTTASGTNRGDYFVDSLFRTDHPKLEGNDEPLRSEARLIMARALSEPNMTPDDKSYLTSLVSARTGLGPAEAGSRVDEVLTTDRQVVDTARRAVAHSLYWLFLALLVGAFCASYAATLGGRQRDRLHS